MAYGTGKYTYELVEEWAKLPEGWSFRDVPGLAIDSQDRVYVFSRSDHPVTVFDRDGNLLTSWGDRSDGRAHGIRIGPDGSVYCTYDKVSHTVCKYTPEGKLLMTLGDNKGQPSETGYSEVERTGPARPATVEELSERLATIKRGGPPFNRPTGIALSSSGEIYVSDGYGNARVHKFAPDGNLLFSWGEPGTGPGQFMLPHDILVDKQERVWVCDRHNGRIQIFDAQGKFLDQRTDLSHPCNVFIDDEETVYVSEIKERPNVSIFTIDGELVARWGSRKEDKDNALFLSDGGPHALVVDSRGDIYVGEIRMAMADTDPGHRAVLKFARKS